MQFVNRLLRVLAGKYILLKGSDVCPNEGQGLLDVVRNKRNQAIIRNNKLEEDIVFKSPSGAAAFVIAGSVNGWIAWKNNEGFPLSIYRNK